MVFSVSGLQQSFRYGFWRNKKITVVHGVDLSISKGEIYAFLGPNGSGKTTTLECIMGLHRRDRGQIKFFDNQELDNNIRKRIGYAPDKVAYFDHLTGWENLMTVGSYAQIEKEEREKAGQELFAELGLNYARDSLVSTYSQGMKQRLGIIISLLPDPDLLIRDEPMNGLDPLGRMLVKKLMKKLQTQGKTILFSTHILSDVEEIADRFCITYQGTIVYAGKVKDIHGNLEDFFCTILHQHSIGGGANIS